MTKLFSFGLNIIADILYPKYCFSCGRSSSYLCKFCVNQVVLLNKSFCVICNKRSSNGYTHPNCKTNYSADRLIAPLSYRSKLISDMIIAGKYYFIKEVFAILAALVANELILNGIKEQLNEFIICAIPLHTQRQRWRGFNQSEIAARILSQALEIPTIPLLVRTRATQTQKNLSAEARKINMSNVFSINKLFANKLPKKVIIVDDVTTTGNTFVDAARALKQHGVKEVWCIAIAKD